MFKNNKKTMKTLAFSLGLVALLLTSTNLNAQYDGSRGLFGLGKSSADYDYSYSNRDGLMDVSINSNTGSGITNDDFGAPLGSGIAILLAAGAGYAVVRRKRSRRNTTLLLACVMLLGFTQCKKEQIVPQSEGNGGEESGVRITLNVNKDDNNGSKAEVDPPHVNFVENDKILVAHDGKYVGTLTYTEYETGKFRFEGNIDATVATPRQKLYFYFLGNKQNDASLTAGTTTSCTVDISDQTSYPTLPVISFSASKEDYEGAGSYSANLHNKASLMKFVVTTDSDAAICVTGMNNKVMVDFSKAANDAQNNGFTYGKVNTDGVITLQGGSGTDVVKWAIVLPTETATPAGDEGSVYTYDGYKGSRPAISNPIAANQYLADGISMTVNTFDIKYAALTFEAKTAGATVTFSKGSSFTGTVQYSTNGGNTWSDYSSAITLSSVGNKVMFRGNNSAYYNGSASKFSCGGDCYLYGNIMSLVSSMNYLTTNSVGDNAFRELFNGNTHIKSHATKHLILPATTIGDYCYMSMFYGCTGLTSVPSDLLPATTLAENCYETMFQGCTALANVPNLPATTLSPRCYYNMFNGCIALTTLPSDLLPATTLADVKAEGGCYEGMFRSCTGLTSVPNLPATTLTTRCYMNMYRQSGLVTVPNDMLIAVTTMAPKCCESMLRECPNLTNVPEIYATNLAEYCCNAMCYHSYKVASAGALHATQLVPYCYYNMYSCCRYITSITCYATDRSAEHCTDLWLNEAGSYATGTKTFITPSTTVWPSGSGGIPDGWTRVDL